MGACYYCFGNMATARTASLTGTVLWSNGNPFDGYVAIGLVLPSGYSSAAPINSWPDPALPLWVKVPINAGQFAQSVTLYFNADLEPPNCRYCAYWYDAQDTLISGPSSIFDIASSPYAIALPALTAPGVSTATPAPPAPPDSGTSPTFAQATSPAITHGGLVVTF